jgi:aspartate ammonia-lyase
MGAYAEAISRDRWRIFKSVERIRVVNLGGTAIGTGLGAPRQYIFEVVGELKRITGYGLARAENLIEATQNADPFVEVSGMLKACATNLQKIANDLRFMSSGPHAGIGEIRLPERQAGSSIMPGKINPVIPEAVVQISLICMANDSVIAQACAMGHLELNPFLPLVADKLLESIDLLANSTRILRDLCIRGIVADETACRRHVENSTATLTALVEHLGYENAQELSTLATSSSQSLKQIVIEKGWLTEEEFEQRVSAESVTRLGSTPSAAG